MTAVRTAPAPGTPQFKARRIARRAGAFRARRFRWLVSLASIVVVIGAWQFVVEAENVSELTLPSPSKIWDRLWTGLQPGPASYYPDLRTTLTEAVLGFAIALVAGVALGLAMGESHVVERILAPYVFALNALPKIAIAPFLVLLLNFGTEAMVSVAAITAFFPMLVNANAGFKSVPNEQTMMFRGLCASRLQTFFRLKLPAALPLLVAGVDLALVYAFLGSIVGEFVGGQEGLGVRITTYVSSVDVTGEFAILVLMAAVGIAIHAVLRLLHAKLLFWTPAEQCRRAR